jgi:hypothetical protein
LEPVVARDSANESADFNFFKLEVEVEVEPIEFLPLSIRIAVLL